ncbi:MAG: hypothetical protein ABMA64_39890 [Myxococcota bacterium]
MTPLVMLGWATAAAAPCTGPTPTTADLTDRLAAAQQAWIELDVDRFKDELTALDAALPCTGDVLGRHLVAELHRFEGLRSFVDRDSERSISAFAAARSIEPTYRFPESVLPTGHPALADYSAGDPDADETTRLPQPLEGRLQLDGMTGDVRSLELPTLFQRVGSDGAAAQTAYLWPGDPAPTYPAAPMDGRRHLGRGLPPQEVVHTGPDRGWLAAAAVAAVGAGAAYGANLWVHSTYQDPRTTPDRLDRLYRLNNALVVVTGSAAAASVGLGASAFVVGRF